MQLVLFDDHKRRQFLPLAYTNTVGDLLIGLATNRVRWELGMKVKTSSITVSNLQAKFPLDLAEDHMLVNSRLIADRHMIEKISSLSANERLVHEGNVLAWRLDSQSVEMLAKEADRNDFLSPEHDAGIPHNDVSPSEEVLILEHLWDFYLMNATVMKADLDLINRTDFSIESGVGNQYLGGQVFIHKDAKVNASVLNAENGPIIIDEGAEVMEGCVIRGPFYLGKHSTLKMGAKIYGATSIGAHSKVGGEVNNSIVNSFSNKAHDGFLGNSVIGQWCNLGADSNNSNLKNDYSIVKLWNYEKESFVRSGQQFLGLMMGDHSKCGINTMFNTGTVVGVSCNIYGSGFQPNFMPSFSWGKPGSFTTYQFEKAMQVAEKVMERRKIALDDTEKALLRSVFEDSEVFRSKFHKPS